MIDLIKANAIAQSVLQIAQRDSAAPLAVAVLDAGGHLKAFLRDDKAGYLRTDIAIAKAWAALGMGQSSRQLAKRADSQPMFFTSLVGISHGKIGLAPGGVLCTDENGTILGAVGVSGDTAEVDERCAVDAIKDAGLLAIS